MKIPDSVKAALWTALFSFMTLFGASVLGFLSDVLEWASSDEVAFPSATPLGKAAAAAVTSAMIGLVNFVVRFAQEQTGVGRTPVYATQRPRRPNRPLRADRGHGDVVTIALVVLVVVVILMLLGRI